MTGPVAPRRQPAQHAAGYYRPSQEQYDNSSAPLAEDETPENVTPESASFLGDDDMLPMSQNSTGSRKRKRATENVGGYSNTDMEHIKYGDELLDYFVNSADDPNVAQMYPPIPPPSFPIDKAIDNQGNNSLHWACSMGDVQFARVLIQRGANIMVQNELSGETPLIRAVLFTNNYDKQIFPKMVNILSSTILERDWHGANVFHHIAETARSRTRWSCARYYCEVLVNRLLESGPKYLQAALTASDKNQDTPIHCALRNGCIKVATFLLNHCPEAAEVPNLQGQTANDLLRSISQKHQTLEQLPSSPIKPGDPVSRQRSRSTPRAVSRAASNVLLRVGPMMEEASERLAALYDAEMRERDTSIAEVRRTLRDLEEQQHKIRQEAFALMTQVKDESEMNTVRDEYEALLQEIESLLERKDHGTLQSKVLAQDQQAPAQAFRSANPQPLAEEEIHAALPLAKELHRQQMRRRQNIRKIARLMGDAASSETIGRLSKLVSITTGLNEEQLDAISIELLESLEANQGTVPFQPPMIPVPQDEM